MDCNYYSTYQSDVLNIFHLFYMKFSTLCLIIVIAKKNQKGQLSHK